MPPRSPRGRLLAGRRTKPQAGASAGLIINSRSTGTSTQFPHRESRLGVVLAGLQTLYSQFRAVRRRLDLGAFSAADRRDRPVLLWLLLSAVHHKVVERL